MGNVQIIVEQKSEKIWAMWVWIGVEDTHPIPDGMESVIVFLLLELSHKEKISCVNLLIEQLCKLDQDIFFHFDYVKVFKPRSQVDSICKNIYREGSFATQLNFASSDFQIKLLMQRKELPVGRRGEVIRIPVANLRATGWGLFERDQSMIRSRNGMNAGIQTDPQGGTIYEKTK